MQKAIYMCRMLFVGTEREQHEVPYNPNKTDFYFEKISGELLPIRKAFKNKYIYFVGTSRGCSCDFGVISNQVNPTLIGQITPLQKVFNLIRRLIGTFQQWESQHIEKVKRQINEIRQYRDQTMRLLSIIECETKKGNAVELYCTWAGEYDAEPISYEVIDTKKVDIRLDFEADERVFRKYI